MNDPLWEPRLTHPNRMIEDGGYYWGNGTSFPSVVHYFGMNEGKEGGTSKREVQAWVLHPIMLRNHKRFKAVLECTELSYADLIPQLARISTMMTAVEKGDKNNEDLVRLVGMSAEDAQEKFNVSQNKEMLLSALLYWWLQDLENLVDFDHNEGIAIMDEFKAGFQASSVAEEKKTACVEAIDATGWKELQHWPPGLQWSKREEHDERPLEYLNRLHEVVQIIAMHATIHKIQEFSRPINSVTKVSPPSWWQDAPNEEEDSLDRLLHVPHLHDRPELACRWELSTEQSRSPQWHQHVAGARIDTPELGAFPVEGVIANPVIWRDFRDDEKRWRNHLRKAWDLRTYHLGIEKFILEVIDSEGEYVLDEPLHIYDKAESIGLPMEQITQCFSHEDVTAALFYITFSYGVEELEREDYNDGIFRMHQDGTITDVQVPPRSPSDDYETWILGSD